MRRPRALSGVALAAIVVAIVILLSGSSGGHTLYARFASAVQVVPGARVTVGGVPVGSVSSIQAGRGTAELKLSLNGGGVWPLHQGTRAQIRMGGDADYANRYVELIPGPVTGAPLHDGAHLPLADTDSPLEFDQLFDIFDKQTRAGMRALFENGSATFGPRAQTLSAGLKVAGPALAQSAATFDALSVDPYALERLVATTSVVASQLAAQDTQLRSLVAGAGRTLTTLAGNAAAVRQTLGRLPIALSDVRSTLAQLDPTLTSADTVIRDVAPGADQLRLLAPPLALAIGALGNVAPQLERTLARVQSSAPTTARFLQRAIPQVKTLRSAFARLAPMLGCARAYSPELAGFFSAWSSLGTIVDPGGRVAQINGQVFPFPDFTPLSSASIAQIFPELRYALVRPAGLSVNQPWMLSGCGISAQGLNPTLDPEAGR